MPELEIGPEFADVTVVTEETDQEDQNKERVRLLEQNEVEFTKVTEGTEEIIVVTNKKQQGNETPIRDNQEISGGGSKVITKEGDTDLPQSTVAGPSRQAKIHPSPSMTSVGTTITSMEKGDIESFVNSKFETEEIESDDLSGAIDQERLLVVALRKLRDATKAGAEEKELARLHDVVVYEANMFKACWQEFTEELGRITEGDNTDQQMLHCEAKFGSMEFKDLATMRMTMRMTRRTQKKLEELGSTIN